MTLASIGSHETDITMQTKNRTQKIKDGSLILTHQLGLGAQYSLTIGGILGNFKTIKDQRTTEHLPEEEKAFFSDRPNIKNLPVGGIIEVWSQSTTHPKEYTVIKYQRLK